MSNFTCEHCGTILYDSPQGYTTGCEHYPLHAHTDHPAQAAESETPRKMGAVDKWPQSLWPSVQEYPQFTLSLGPTEQMELAEVVIELERALNAERKAREELESLYHSQAAEYKLCRERLMVRSGDAERAEAELAALKVKYERLQAATVAVINMMRAALKVKGNE